MVCLLVRGREAAEDEDVLVGDLVESTAFEADPVCVFFDPQVQRLPVLSPSDIVLFDQIRSLATVKARNNVERCIVKGNRRVEIASSVEARNLRPSIGGNIVHFALVH